MSRTDSFNYFDGGTFQALELPYQNKEISMIVFLPRMIDGLTAFEQTLTTEKIQQWLSQLRPASKVIVVLPKFKMEKQFELRDTLASTGMKQAFDGVKADFSGMASKETMLRDGNFYIAAVIHKAFVDVNEEGTEAAAATGDEWLKPICAGCTHEPPVITFFANHPFLFLIRDNKSGSILFMGRVADPSR